MADPNLQSLITHCVAEGLPLTLAYHPDADPGDGRGWAVEMGDLTVYGDGSLDGAVVAALLRCAS